MPLLPIVTEEVDFAIQAELLQAPGNEYLREMIKKLQKENPCVINFISHFATSSQDPLGASYCGILVYRLLESQAEANKMDQTIK